MNPVRKIFDILESLHDGKEKLNIIFFSRFVVLINSRC
jgi:hypothetical protein